MKDIAKDETLYERDFAEWCAQQCAVLDEPHLGTPDWANIREEIEGLAARDRKELQNRIIRVIEHMLKMDHSRATDPIRGWQESIWSQQVKIEVLLDQSPSLRQHIDGMIAWGYSRAVKNTIRSLETYEAEHSAEIIAKIPETCPYDIGKILGDDISTD